MAYSDWIFAPKAKDGANVTGNYVWAYGIAPAGYWINKNAGRFVNKYMLCKSDERRMKVVLAKEWRYGRVYYNADFAVERLNGETSYQTQIYRVDEDENGYSSSPWFDNANFSVFDNNTLVWHWQLLGDDLELVDPQLPIYDSDALAYAAMSDEIWKEKTKYHDGGYSQDGGGGEGSTWGGGGLFDHSSDSIDFSALPVDYGTATKLFQIYLPTQAELSSFADFLFSSAFDVNTLKKLFVEPMSYILGLSVFPLPISATSQGAHNIYIGDVNTGVQAHLCNKQFLEFDCGSLLVKPFWDAYLDYAPYTKMTLFLPFIGYKELDTDDIVGKTLHIKYQIDIITGACMAQVKVGDSVRYSFIGQCSANIPLSAQDWTQSIQGAITIAGQIGTMATTGAVSASGISNVASTAVNMVKPNVQRSGGFSGSGAFMGYKTPYLVITRPVQALAENHAELKGFPSYTFVTLGTCSGFTQIESWQPDGFTCSKNELDEIERLLKEGVYL